MSFSSMGVLLTLLLFATVVSGSGVDGLSNIEGGEAFPQSHAASGLLQTCCFHPIANLFCFYLVDKF